MLGASGLVGRQLTEFLLEDPAFSRVTLLVRRSMPIESRKLRQIEVDFEQLEEHAKRFRNQLVFICLGTTMKKAGSQEAFEKVDYHYPLQAAELAAREGARHVLVITALGSNPKSMMFYNRTKGRLEQSLSELNLPALTIFRPSLLSGPRTESRLGEEVGNLVGGVLGFAMAGPLKRYRPIEARTVARAMAIVAKEEGAAGKRVLESHEIQALVTASAAAE